MVENVFKTIHEEQLEQLGKQSYLPLQEEKEVDGKMDKKTFLDYVGKSVLFQMCKR